MSNRLQFVKTLKGELIGLDHIGHASASGSSGMVSVGTNVVVITMDEFAALEKKLSPEQLVEPPPPNARNDSGEQQSEAPAPHIAEIREAQETPDAADAEQQMAEAKKRGKPKK